MNLLRFAFFIFVISVCLPSAVFAAVLIPFTINMSKVVSVTGSPRIAIDVGGTTRYAVYSAGTGTSTLTFTYSVQSGDVDANGVVLTSPMQLNGGTITDAAGNPASLTFTLPNTTGILVNGAVPSGYTAVLSDDTVTNVNKTALSFVLTSPKLNRTYNYTITSSGGGVPLTGTGTQTTSPQTISGVNVTSLPDGILTLSLTLTDSLGGVGIAATDTIPMAVLNANLVGHWTFDTNDISGVTALDRSGSSNNGTLTNGPVATTGMTGNALTFDGTNDTVALTGLTGVDTVTAGAKTTVAMWIFWAGGNSQMPFSWGVNNCDLWFASGHFGINTYNSDIYGIASTGLNGTWLHVVAEFNNGSGTVSKLSINGVAQTLTQRMGVTGSKNISTMATIGGGGGGAYYFSSKIDDVRIYNTSLTAGQITTLYNTH